METYVKRNYGNIIVQKLKSGLACLLVISLLMTALLATPSSASADMKLVDVDVGTNPVAVVVNPVTNKIYVTNSGSDKVTVIDGATDTTTTVPVGNYPTAVAVNPMTNKIYVANSGSDNVTVIDGVTNTTTSVQVGNTPSAVAVNPVTNKIYITNMFGDSVTVIDGATNSTEQVEVGEVPVGVAVNPVTNKIYVTNVDSDEVTVIDGADNSATQVPVEEAPYSVAVNPVTNKIYVVNESSNSVTVIDGADNSTEEVLVGDNPYAVAVNPVTNKIYVTNMDSDDVTVIDGADNSKEKVSVGSVGSEPGPVAVNPVTNKIYVTNMASNFVTVIDGATNETTSVPAGSEPGPVAVNPVTNKIYVANWISNNVTVIDGADNSTTPVSVGSEPRTVAVNPVTNKIYVANSGSNNVTVIDGADNSTTTVPVGDLPTVVAVNPVTNKIYVTNFNSNNVTVIDGSTNSTTTVPAGVNPNAVAVNEVTNRIYVANWYGDDVTVIDGVDHSTTTVPVGDNPIAVAVNPVTNKIYVTNSNSNDVMVIDGATQTTTRVPVGDHSTAVTVNAATNKIYVTNNLSNNVTVIDGVTHQTTQVPVGERPIAVAVNAVTNKIYVVDHFNDSVTVIDGASHTTTEVTVGNSPYTVVVNAVTNKIYVTNVQNSFVTVIDGATNVTTRVETVGHISAVAVNAMTNKIYVANRNSVTVIDDARRTPNPLEVEVTPLHNNIAYGTDATFTFQVSNGYSPYASVVQSVYFQLDTTQGPWVQANPSGSDWTATVSSLTYGKHELFVLALEAQGNGVPAGVAKSYSFYSVPPSTISPTSASFDKYIGSAGHADVLTTFALNGNTLTSIANGVTNLAAGTDYTVSGNTITISKAYLAAQPVGTTSLTFTFSHGATQTLEITVSDSPPPYTGGSGRHSSSVSKLVIDVNGSAVAPDSIDTTKRFVAIEVTPKDGAAYVSIPATILTDIANKNAAFYFDIKAPYGSYQVPVQLASFIPGLADLLAASGLKIEDISFKMTLIDRSGDQSIQAALGDSLPKRKVMGEIVDFQIDIINTNTGQTIGNADRLTKALTTYIPMPKSMKDMPAQWGAFRYNEARKKFEFVAAKSVQIGGIWYVTINSYFNASHVVVENAATFTDTLTHWGKSFVELAAAKGLVEGVGNGQFAPNKIVTRAEFTAMLVRALGRGHSIGSTASYVDVKSGAWYYEEVATAKELGLLDFVSGTSFHPELPLTREEMASMLAAVVELEELPLTKDFVSLDGYKDIAPADSAYLEDVRLMVKLHIMTGTGKNQFSPKGITTRAQAAVVLIRTLQVLDRIDGYKE